MQIEKSGLMGLLEAADRELARPIRIVAVGGTAMTLLGLKPSTIDIDFDLPSEDAKEFRSALNKVPHGFRIDIFSGGLIFSQQLLEDYLSKAIAIRTGLKNIRLFALHPLDIIVTKTGRLNERDMQDIGSCIAKFHITREQIEERASAIGYAGRQESYDDNLRHVTKAFFRN